MNLNASSDLQAELVHLEDQTRFLEGGEKGITASERAEFIEEDEMDARIAEMLKP